MGKRRTPRIRVPQDPEHQKRFLMRWSEEDDALLRRLWDGEHSMEEVAHELGRSDLSVYWRVRKLGLPCGCPQGYEYLTAAAERTGFTTQQLRKLLAKAHVPIHESITRMKEKRKRWHHFVAPDAVDGVIAKWAQTEVVNAAAGARGMIAPTLQQWLLDAGYKPPRKKKAHWRLPSSVIDKVVNARRAVRSVSEHARRVKVDRVTLAGKLREAGVLGEKKPGTGGIVRLSDEIVDQVLVKFPVRRSRTRNAATSEAVAAE